jgi:hypothetical protein
MRWVPDGPTVDAARSYVMRLLLEDAGPFSHCSEVNMKLLLIALVASGLALASTGADAKGCLKGAVVGGAAGHFAGHHGLLGAAAGCAIGHHQANKAAKQQQSKQPQTTGSAPSK